jgi:predicted amidohydrolase
MKNLKISTVQFENRSGDKKYNLSRIDHFASVAASEGSSAVAFHECSVTGYTFARHLSKEQLFDLCEPVPDGPSVSELVRIAAKNKIAVLAGLFEKEDGKIYKTYVCVDGKGLNPAAGGRES